MKGGRGYMDSVSGGRGGWVLDGVMGARVIRGGGWGWGC